MLSIQLKNLSFHSYHGLYAEEKILGNKFLVNMHVRYLPQIRIITQLDQALNYETLFSMVYERMLVPTPLLETITMELCHAVLDLFQEVKTVFVSVEKTNPPIPNFDGGVVVSFQLERENRNG